ncbi:TPA: RNA-binding protein [Legionella anisa]|uniref:RNA-binding protein n=1 Tax=Legionella anisa TaxID=28082 RepID=UPI0037C139C6
MSEFGSIDDIKIIIDRYTGESKGFAFITFSSNSSAIKALNMDEKELKERTILVSAARKKENFRGNQNRW